MELKEHLKEYLSRGRYLRDIREFHPSEISSNCDRKLFYIKTIPTEYSPELLKIFEEGHFIHNFMEKFLEWLERKGVIELISVEKSRVFSFFGKEFFIDGTHDAIVRELDSGKIYIYDFKSIKALKYYDKNNNLKDVPLPKPEHLKQINLYMFAHRIYNGKLIYIDRLSFFKKYATKDINIKEVEVVYDENLVLDKLLQIERVFQHLKERKLPKKIDEKMEHWECRYCQFKEEWCKKNKNPFNFKNLKL